MLKMLLMVMKCHQDHRSRLKNGATLEGGFFSLKTAPSAKVALFSKTAPQGSRFFKKGWKQLPFFPIGHYFSAALALFWLHTWHHFQP